MVLAESLGEVELVAQAALANGAIGFVFGLHDPYEIVLLRQVLRTLPSADSALRARIMARLASELVASATSDEHVHLAEAAIDMAKRVQDRRALAYALYCWHVAVWTPDNLALRLERARHAIALAESYGDLELVGRMRHFLVADLVEAGRFAAARPESERHAELAERLRQPLFRWHVSLHKVMRLLAEGELLSAEEEARNGLTLGAGVSPDAEMTYAGQMGGVRLREGALSEGESIGRSAGRPLPLAMVWMGHYAIERSRAQGRNAVNAAYADLRRAITHDLPRDMTWLAVAYSTGVLAFEAGDRAGAAPLRDLLAPYADRFAYAGVAVFCVGPLAYPLALLEAMLGNWRAASRYFGAVQRACVRNSATVHLAIANLGWARATAMRGRTRDRETAARLASAALEIARRTRMRALAKHAQAFLRSISQAPARRGVRARAAVRTSPPELSAP